MELSSHGECCEFSDEKDLVNTFGGVAYDHDSMPKVVAVHTLSPEKLNKEHSSIIDRLPRNIIGIRSKPKKLRNLSMEGKRPGMWALQERELGCGHMNKNEDYLKTADATTEVCSVAEKLSLPCEINTQTVTFSEDSNTRNGSLEYLDWFSIGVLAEKSPDELNLQPCSGKGLTAGKNNREGQIIESCSYESMPKSSTKTLKVAASGKFASIDTDEDKKRGQETCSNIGKTAGKSSLEMCLAGTDNQKQKIDCLIPRKRPRKSIPRKIDIKSEHFGSCSHSTDSEETLSADETTSELSSNKCTPVVSPKSSRSDSISPRGTKVIFKRTAGVWSVSPLVSDVGSSNRESDADDVKQSKKMCLFADRPIAPLVICDSLNANCKEHCYSPALDREIRIKELIRKREKLLAEVRRSRAESQISLL